MDELYVNRIQEAVTSQPITRNKFAGRSKNFALSICTIMKLFEPPLSRIITGKVPQ